MLQRETRASRMVPLQAGTEGGDREMAGTLRRCVSHIPGLAYVHGISRGNGQPRRAGGYRLKLTPVRRIWPGRERAGRAGPLTVTLYSASAAIIRVGREQPRALARLCDEGTDRVATRLGRSVSLGCCLCRLVPPKVWVDVTAGTRTALGKRHAHPKTYHCGGGKKYRLHGLSPQLFPVPSGKL